MIMFIVGNMSALNKKLNRDANSFDHDILILLVGFIESFHSENASRRFLVTLS